MTAYDLDRLGPARFEEMCQALAIAVFGPKVQVFGQGSDGGRDGTFEALQGDGLSWTGLTVIQVKARQSPDPKTDPAWLTQKLRSWLLERSKPTASSSSPARVPQGVIVMTNVSLSAVAGAGGIDQIDAAMRRMTAEFGLPLEGWEIWHRDKIRRLLDLHRSVRETYLDHVLPADILAQLQQFVKASERFQPREPVPVLPRETRKLFGRDDGVRRAVETLSSPADGSRAVVVSGEPGIGKSAVALRIGHRLADQFPDGQVHLDLTLMGAPADPVDIVPALLEALWPGSEAALPADRTLQKARLRELLSGRRVLVLVDGLTSESTLTELLQLEAGVVAVCTSQMRLSGLTDIVHSVDLAPLTTEDSRELVRSIVRGQRMTDEQVAALVQVCTGHPFALQLAASHIASRPKLDVDRYVKGIADPADGLRALAAGQAALRPVIERAVTSLSPQQKALLVQLGVLPRMSITADVATCLVTPETELRRSRLKDTARLLDSLVELNLLEQEADSRYALSSIMHRYAASIAEDLPPAATAEVVHRACMMLAVRCQLHTQAIGYNDPDTMTPADGTEAALGELAFDRPAVVGLAHLAHRHELWTDLNLLVANATAYLWHRRYLADLEAIYGHLLEAGEHTSDNQMVSVSHHNLGMILAHRGDTSSALDHLQRADDVARAGVDPHQVFTVQFTLASLLLQLGRAHDALGLLKDTLRFWRLTENWTILALALQNIAAALILHGRLNTAEKYLESSARISRKAGQTAHSTLTLIGLQLHSRTDEQRLLDLRRRLDAARAFGDLSEEAKALTLVSDYSPGDEPDSPGDQHPLERALEIYEATEDAHGRARTLLDLGQLAQDQGDPATAIQRFSECAKLAREIGDDPVAASALMYLVKYLRSTGHVHDADRCMSEALALAERTSSPLVVASTRVMAAHSKLRESRPAEAAELARQAITLLQSSDDENARNKASLTYAEALLDIPRWTESAKTIESVLESATASATARCRALRLRAQLYSRRGLSREAITDATRALEIAESEGSRTELVHCYSTLGGVHGRQGEWEKAEHFYEKVLHQSAANGDLHARVTARAMLLISRLQVTSPDVPDQTEVDQVIHLATNVGLTSIAFTLHNALGAWHAENREHGAAINRFNKASVVAESLGNRDMIANSMLNLARIHAESGDVEQAMVRARSAFWIWHDNEDWSRAAATLAHLTQMHFAHQRDGDPPSLAALLASERRVKPQVRSAFDALQNSAPVPRLEDGPGDDDGPKKRRLHISDEVVSAIAARAGIDTAALAQLVGASEQWCVGCGLRIDEGGEAALVLFHNEHGIAVRLAHTSCSPSHAVRADGAPIDMSQTRFETECVYLVIGNIATPGIVVNVINGFIANESGVVDFVLEDFLELGFERIDEVGGLVDMPERSSKIPPITNTHVTANLAGDTVHIHTQDGENVTSIPLKFKSEWYKAASSGRLAVLIGRHLTGEVADDIRYSQQAAKNGELLGATIALEVTHPTRNRPCPCAESKGKKFKRCCGLTPSNLDPAPASRA